MYGRSEGESSMKMRPSVFFRAGKISSVSVPVRNASTRQAHAMMFIAEKVNARKRLKHSVPTSSPAEAYVIISMLSRRLSAMYATPLKNSFLPRLIIPLATMNRIKKMTTHAAGKRGHAPCKHVRSGEK